MSVHHSDKLSTEDFGSFAQARKFWQLYNLVTSAFYPPSIINCSFYCPVEKLKKKTKNICCYLLIEMLGSQLKVAAVLAQKVNIIEIKFKFKETGISAM